MLTKYTFISKETFEQDIQNGLKLEQTLTYYIEENIDSLSKNTIIFSNGETVIDSVNHTELRIPILFVSDIIKNNNKQIHKSIYSFDQNNMYLADDIRDYVIEKILSNVLLQSFKKHNINNVFLGIGGEYYLYQCLLKDYGKYNKYIGITNNLQIYNDAEFNYSRFKISDKYNNKQHYLIQSYNQLVFGYNNTFNLEELIQYLSDPKNKIDIVINLAKLNVNVVEFINYFKNNISTLVIISCKQTDFEKKSMLMPSIIKDNMKCKSFNDHIMKQTVQVYYYYKK